MAQELNEYRGPTYGSPYYDIDEVDAVLAEKDAEIAELKDKCQMHDFFWEGCRFAKRGFKNTIAVSEAFDKLEAENDSLLQQNRELCQALQVMYSKDAYDKQKYKRCLAMARWCDEVMMSCELRGYAVHRIWANKHQWAMRWKYRWLELAEKFKEAK